MAILLVVFIVEFCLFIFCLFFNYDLRKIQRAFVLPSAVNYVSELGGSRVIIDNKITFLVE
jgi:hypothetical protein